MNKLLVIDGDFLLFTATHGNKICNRYGVPYKENGKFIYTPKTLGEVYETADQIIREISDKTDTTAYIGYLGHTRNFRYDIYPEYKANRRNRELPAYFKECKEYLYTRWNFQLCHLPLEADDYVNITRNRLQNDYQVIVVSNDKDLVRCTPGTFYVPKIGEFITTSNAQADYAFYYSMITGDSTDNIKGCKGKGPVAATRQFTDLCWSETYASATANLYREVYGEDYLPEYELKSIIS